MNFDNLHLHDSTLSKIEYNWQRKEATLLGKTLNTENREVVDFQLKFIKVQCMEVSHDEKWGKSSSIYKVFEEDKKFCIEMQTGDILKFSAEDFRFEMDKKL